MLFRDVFTKTLQPHLTPRRENWTNHAGKLPGDVAYREKPGGEHQKPTDSMTALERDAWRSEEACSAACAEREKCYTWYFDGSACFHSRSFALGNPVQSENKGAVSGWDLDRIRAFVEGNGCGEVRWVTDENWFWPPSSA